MGPLGASASGPQALAAGRPCLWPLCLTPPAPAPKHAFVFVSTPPPVPAPAFFVKKDSSFPLGIILNCMLLDN